MGRQSSKKKHRDDPENDEAGASKAVTGRGMETEAVA